jgi:predicted N-formylglutamate amidohydrolase
MAGKEWQLLGADDPPPVSVTNGEGTGLFLLLGDHAGNRVPERLHSLGLPPAELTRHIALDLGVSELGRALAMVLDAPFVEQRYSRLVIDCNRSPAAAESIAGESDGTPVPGNAGLDAAARRQRLAEVFDPYHRAIGDRLRSRRAAGRRTVLVSLHSFTPVLAGVPRPWDIGVLHDGGETRFATRLLAALQASEGWCVGDNEPYRMDATDYTVPRHAYAARLPYAELEVRQDHLATPDALHRIIGLLAETLTLSAR